MLLERSDQSQLIELRRAQVVDEPAEVGDSVLDLGLQLVQHHAGRSRVPPNQQLGRTQLQDKAGHDSTEPVVEVPPQSAALLLPGGDQPFTRTLQVDGQPDGVGGHAGLAGDVRQKPEVGG
jgi:hypothetical protein